MGRYLTNNHDCSVLRPYLTVPIKMPHPTFKSGSDVEDVVFDDILATRNFVADDLMVGVSVLTGRATSGAVRTGVVTEIIPGVGIRFDNPVQNGIFWSEMWQHLGDCECPVCCEHIPVVAARLAAVEEARLTDAPPPPAPLRRSDSGSDYSMCGFPDCEFWVRSGYEPLFVGTSADYTGHSGSYLAEAWSRNEAMAIINDVDPETLPRADRQAWERQRAALQDADDIYPAQEWGGSDGERPMERPSFMEPPGSPPRTPRPVICPDAPARLRSRRGAVSPVPPLPPLEAEEEADLEIELEPDIWHTTVTARIPLWHLFVALLVLSAYLFLVVFQLESCKKCLR